MQYILKSRIRLVATLAHRALRRDGIKSEVEPLLAFQGTGRGYGVAVAEDDVRAATRAIWGAKGPPQHLWLRE